MKRPCGSAVLALLFATNQSVYIYCTATTPFPHHRVSRLVANSNVELLRKILRIDAGGTIPAGSTNVAAASNGGTAIASSTYASGFDASGTINGDRKGQSWGNGGGWNDATPGSWPDWLEVDFAGATTIDEVDVFSVQDNYTAPE